MGPIWLCAFAQLISEMINQVKEKYRLTASLYNVAHVILAAVIASNCYRWGEENIVQLQGGNVSWALIWLMLVGTFYTAFSSMLSIVVGVLDSKMNLKGSFIMAKQAYGYSQAIEILLIPIIVALVNYWPPTLVFVVVPLAFASRYNKLSAQLTTSSMHDQTTGLPNRHTVEEQFHETVQSGTQRLAVIVVQIDNLGDMTRAMGHQAGDQLMCDIAARLNSVTRQGTDIVGRLGSSRFVVLAPLEEGVENPPDVKSIGDRLLTSLRDDFRLQGVRVSVLATAGASLYPDHGQTARELLPKAEAAILDAPRGQTSLHDPANEISSPERLSVLGQLRHAIDNGQLEVHYQPKVDASTEIVMGAEALVRWRHPERGLIPPMDFIPLAESTGLVNPMTWVVLDHALSQVKRWTNHHWGLKVSVNFAADLLIDSETPALVARALQHNQVSADLLIIEVTESSLIKDAALAMQTITAIRHLGVQVSVDDYGTGYSSLAYLQKLDADELKIDRAFVKNLGAPDNQHDLAIVETTVALGHRLGMAIVAEGVETAVERQILEDAGCDMIQGFFYSKPLPGPELTAWLAQRQVRPHLPSTLPTAHQLHQMIPQQNIGQHTGECESAPLGFTLE